MKISYIVRPFCDIRKIMDYTDRLKSVCDDEFQIIVWNKDLETYEDEDVSGKARLTVIEAQEEDYFFNAVKAAKYEYLTITSADMSYAFFDDEQIKADIAAINFDVQRDSLFFRAENEITGGLLCFEKPLSRCLVKTELIKSVVFSGSLADAVYEELTAIGLLNKAENMCVCQGIRISPFEIRSAGFEKAQVLLYAESVAKLLRMSDIGIRVYMLCCMLLPFFREPAGGRATRECYGFLNEIIGILYADEESRKFTELLTGYDVSVLVRYGYYGYYAMCGSEALSVYFIPDSINRVSDFQRKSAGSETKALNVLKSSADSAKSEYKKLMARLKTVENKLQTAQTAVNECKRRLSRPDAVTMSDNLFYLSETTAAVYDFCKELTEKIRQEEK